MDLFDRILELSRYGYFCGQIQHTAGMRLAARVALHLSSSARSTDATLPSASSSGT